MVTPNQTVQITMSFSSELIARWENKREKGPMFGER